MSTLAATLADRRGVWAGLAVGVGLAAGLVAALAPQYALLAGLVVLGLAAAVAVVAWPQVGVVLIVAALPLDEYGRVLSRPVLLTVYQLLLMLTLASWGWRLLARTERYKPSALDVGMLGLLAAAVWSWPFSLDRAATTLAVARLGFLWLFTALMAHYLADRRVANWVLGMFLATVTAAAALAIAQYLVPDLPIGNVHVQTSLEGEQLSRVSALYSDPNNLAGLLSVGVTTCAALLVHAKRAAVRLPVLGVLAVSGAALVVTYSRTGWVGALAGLVIVALTAPPRARLALLSAGAGLAVVAALVSPAAITERVQSIFDYRRDTSVATRVYMTQSLVQIAEQNWQFGTGLGAFSQAYPAYRNIRAIRTITKPHQVPLAMVAEAGIAGLVAMIVLVGALVWVFFVSRAGPWTTFQSVALAGLVALMVQSLFQYYLYFEYVWFFAALGVAAARMRSTTEEVVS